MIIKIQGDLFKSHAIESICRSEETDKCIEINTISGSTYEYKYDSVESADAVMNYLQKVLSSEHDIVDVSIKQA